MTATLGTFVDEVRGILRDPQTTGSTQHYTDTAILRAVMDGFRRLWNIRPDSRYTGDNLTINDVVFPTDPTQYSTFPVSFDERWRLGVIYFAVARCWEQDVTDTVTLQLAAEFFKKADAIFTT